MGEGSNARIQTIIPRELGELRRKKKKHLCGNVSEEKGKGRKFRAR